MENFIVSARKYRPVTFDTVVGQPYITATLKNAIRSHHLAQAFLFTGPRGVGKTTTARILAKTINCQNISENIEACNQCESCTSFNNNHSLNIYELDAASNNSVDDIRALVEQVRYSPQGGKYKVYIIDEVHMLSANAFNAFLKTLEEPPSYAIFILATTEKHKILPTILSRCQIFDFSRITVDDISTHLMQIAQKEGVNAEEDGLQVIAQKSDGALRDALSMFDQMVSFSGSNLTYKSVIQNLNILDYDYYFKITDELLTENISGAFLTFNEILANGFDGHNFIDGLSSHFRDLLVCKDEITLQLLQVTPKIREKYKVQSGSCTVPWLLQALDITSKCDINYRAAKNQRLHVELSLLKMCSIGKEYAEGSKKKVEPEAATSAVNQSSTPVSAPTKPQVAYKVPVAAPAKVAEASLMKRNVSIKDSVNKPEQQKPTTSAAEEVLPEATSVNAVDLEKAWVEYGNKLQQQGRMAISVAILKRLPEITDDNKVLFTIDHAGLEKDLNEIRPELLAFLRSTLSNPGMQLITKIYIPQEGERKAYTAQEKYKRMLEKNPAIDELRRQLDLEIE